MGTSLGSLEHESGPREAVRAPWKILRNAEIFLGLPWETEDVCGAAKVLMEIWGSHGVFETLPGKFKGV